jgi:hypothetical protein
MEHTTPFGHSFDQLANFESRDGLRTPVLLLEAEYNRARACWAACDGVPLDEVENLANIGGLNALTVEAGQAYADADALKAQRDELLAGLELAYIAMQHMGNVLNNIDAVDEEEDAQHDAAFEAVAALIAKHKEASHG